MNRRGFNTVLATSAAIAAGATAPTVANARNDAKAHRYIGQAEQHLAAMVVDQFHAAKQVGDPNAVATLKKLRGQERSLTVVIKADNPADFTGQYRLRSTMKKVDGELDPATSTEVSVESFSGASTRAPSKSSLVSYFGIEVIDGMAYTDEGTVRSGKTWLANGYYFNDPTPIPCSPDHPEAECQGMLGRQMTSEAGKDLYNFSRPVFNAMFADAVVVYQAATRREPVAELHTSPLPESN